MTRLNSFHSQDEIPGVAGLYKRYPLQRNPPGLLQLSLLDDLYDILVLQPVLLPYALRTVLHTKPPYLQRLGFRVQGSGFRI